MAGAADSTRRLALRLGLPALLGARAFAAGAVANARAAGAAVDDAAAALAAIERRHGGRLGFYALDTATGRTLARRADERYLMCSTFKGLLAAQVLARVDAGRERLDRLVRFTRADLLFTSPVTAATLARGASALTVGALLDACLVHSDNTAAVLLMRASGGPAALTAYLRGLGDAVTRSDRYEPASNRASGALDTTSPRAVATTLGRLLLGDALSAASRERLEAGMRACLPGLQRLRAALPAGWLAADRPGTSVEAETNDVAILRPPGRAPLLVAAYYEAPRLGTDLREAVLREAGAVCVGWAGA